MFSFFRYLRNRSPNYIKFLFYFLGSFYRYLIILFNINFSINQKIYKFGPFKIHSLFAFSNFQDWGFKNEFFFNHMMKDARNKKCIIDIGSHIGLMTLPFSKCVKKHSLIYSFEPSKINFFYLSYHISSNDIKNVNLINKLVGEKNKNKSVFYESPQPTGMNSILMLKKKNITFKKKYREVVTLDYFVKKQKIKPDLIKIDAEGSEISILKGGIKTFIKYKPKIYLSVHKEYLKSLGYTDKDFFNILKKIKYKIKDSKGNITTKLENKEYLLYK